MSLTEKQIEDVFQVFFRQLIQKDLTFVARQHVFDNKLRADLLFQDSKGRHVILEIKKDAITREDVGQALQYSGMISKARVILAAPHIPSPYKIAFDHYGIEYREFKRSDIEKLIPRLKDRKPKPKTGPKDEPIIKGPLSTGILPRKIQDGNVAFKVTFSDSNWNGVCSDNLYQHNTVHRVWCKQQKDNRVNCRSPRYRTKTGLSQDCPCYESVALKELRYCAGWFHGPKKGGTPMPCLHAKVGKVALFTSKEPGAPENARFIFAIAKISHFDRKSQFGESEDFVC
ncbi:MAG: hypothetical protein HQM09_24650, partial [Candidatus Riflebacteria bacterium]|nr:hypothetical protein [Candidatus Riflebacteria bacterium]